MKGTLAKARRLLADPDAIVVVAEHRDRLGRMNTELAKAVICAHGRPLVASMTARSPMTWCGT
jgi:putative resolvase